MGDTGPKSEECSRDGECNRFVTWDVSGGLCLLPESIKHLCYPNSLTCAFACCSIVAFKGKNQQSHNFYAIDWSYRIEQILFWSASFVCLFSFPVCLWYWSWGSGKTSRNVLWVRLSRNGSSSPAGEVPDAVTTGCAMRLHPLLLFWLWFAVIHGKLQLKLKGMWSGQHGKLGWMCKYFVSEPVCREIFVFGIFLWVIETNKHEKNASEGKTLIFAYSIKSCKVDKSGLAAKRVNADLLSFFCPVRTCYPPEQQDIIFSVYWGLFLTACYFPFHSHLSLIAVTRAIHSSTQFRVFHPSLHSPPPFLALVFCFLICLPPKPYSWKQTI